MINKVTAKELKNIRLCYQDIIRDYSACVGAKELEYWASCAECSIDRHVQTLDRGVSKQNHALLKEVGEAYQRLQDKLDSYNRRLVNKARSGNNVIPLFR
jgi:hypothetical protein